MQDYRFFMTRSLLDQCLLQHPDYCVHRYTDLSWDSHDYRLLKSGWRLISRLDEGRLDDTLFLERRDGGERWCDEEKIWPLLSNLMGRQITAENRHKLLPQSVVTYEATRLEFLTAPLEIEFCSWLCCGRCGLYATGRATREYCEEYLPGTVAAPDAWLTCLYDTYRQHVPDLSASEQEACVLFQHRPPIRTHEANCYEDFHRLTTLDDFVREMTEEEWKREE